MKHVTRNVLLGYGGFCLLNWWAAYFTARSGSPFLLGSAGLLQLNENLAPLNLLRRVVDPITAAERHAAAAGSGSPPPLVMPGGTMKTIQFDPNTLDNPQINF